MPADRPLRNLGREALLDLYTFLPTEPESKRFNLRKELQTDRNSNTFANRWVTRDQFYEMVSAEIRERGLEAPAAPGAEAPTGTEASAEAEASPEVSAAPATEEAKPAE